MTAPTLFDTPRTSLESERRAFVTAMLKEYLAAASSERRSRCLSCKPTTSPAEALIQRDHRQHALQRMRDVVTALVGRVG